MTRKHWVGYAGISGCMPAMVVSDDTKSGVVDQLVDAHTDENFKTPRVKGLLKKEQFVFIDLQRFGNEYLEIVQCDCEQGVDGHVDW